MPDYPDLLAAKAPSSHVLNAHYIFLNAKLISTIAYLRQHPFLMDYSAQMHAIKTSTS
jgi:hypothetical protein